MIVAHCSTDNKAPPDLSLAMLVLLETLLTAPGNEQYWPALTPNLVRKAVVGNMVWKVGRVASTVRKVRHRCRQGETCAFLPRRQSVTPRLVCVA